MSKNDALGTLLAFADTQLKDCTIALGKTQTVYVQADNRLTQLQSYYQAYCIQIQQQIETAGVRSDLLNINQCFLHKLQEIISEQKQQVEQCFQEVERQRGRWRQDKRRFNMFSVLKRRRDDIRDLADVRREQKLMDDFALSAVSRQGSDGNNNQYIPHTE